MKLLFIALITLFVLTLTITGVSAQTLEPTVTVVRESDNSLTVSWENIPTNGRYYLAHFTGPINTSGIGYDGASPHHIPTNHDFYDVISKAERIGVIATNADNTSVGSYSYASVPPLLPIVTADRQADNSILISWENIPTTNSYDVHGLLEVIQVRLHLIKLAHTLFSPMLLIFT